MSVPSAAPRERPLSTDLASHLLIPQVTPASRLSCAPCAMACFTDASYQLTGDLQEVDHIGPQSTEKLNKQGIYTTYQLLGHFLQLDRNKTAFLALLKCLLRH